MIFDRDKQKTVVALLGTGQGALHSVFRKKTNIFCK